MEKKHGLCLYHNVSFARRCTVFVDKVYTIFIRPSFFIIIALIRFFVWSIFQYCRILALVAFSVRFSFHSSFFFFCWSVNVGFSAIAKNRVSRRKPTQTTCKLFSNKELQCRFHTGRADAHKNHASPAPRVRFLFKI